MLAVTLPLKPALHAQPLATFVPLEFAGHSTASQLVSPAVVTSPAAFVVPAGQASHAYALFTRSSAAQLAETQLPL